MRVKDWNYPSMNSEAISILIVEDDPQTAIQMRRIVESDGYRG